MFLMPWTHPDGRVIDEELRVAPEVSRGVAIAAPHRYRRGVAVRVTATRITKQRGFTYWNADGITRVEKLRRWRSASQADVAVQHPLGRLVLDRGRGAFVGKRGRVELVIDRVDRLLATSIRRVHAIEARQAKIHAAISKRLVPLYNTHWRAARPAIDAAAFARRLTLTTIHVGDVRTTLYYTSGALFGDHGIEVRIGVRGGISEISIS